VILGQKLTINHPSLVNEGEETRILVTVSERAVHKNNSYKFLQNNNNNKA